MIAELTTDQINAVVSELKKLPTSVYTLNEITLAMYAVKKKYSAVKNKFISNERGEIHEHV